MYEFNSVLFESLDLPILLDDCSLFDVQCALKDDKVKPLEYLFITYSMHMMFMITAIVSILLIIALMLINGIFDICLIVSKAIYTIHVELFSMFLA